VEMVARNRKALVIVGVMHPTMERLLRWVFGLIPQGSFPKHPWRKG
jgi:hypothetical protein